MALKFFAQFHIDLREQGYRSLRNHCMTPKYFIIGCLFLLILGGIGYL